MSDVTLVVRNEGEDSDSILTFTGRDAWALRELMKAKTRGVTPITHPAPRWSAYIYNLRNSGLTIETIHEAHQGAFPGTHGRYVLRSKVWVVAANDNGHG